MIMLAYRTGRKSFHDESELRWQSRSVTRVQDRFRQAPCGLVQQSWERKSVMPTVVGRLRQYS